MAKDDPTPTGDGDGDGDGDDREKLLGELGDMIESRVDAALEKRFGKPKDNGKPAGGNSEKKTGGFLESIFGA